MRNLLRRSRYIKTEYGNYCLEYQIHERNEEGSPIYGISIFQYKMISEKRRLFDQASIEGFSESLKDTQIFFRVIYRGNVFPVHLHEVADDWCSSCLL